MGDSQFDNAAAEKSLLPGGKRLGTETYQKNGRQSTAGNSDYLIRMRDMAVTGRTCVSHTFQARQGQFTDLTELFLACDMKHQIQQKEYL